MSTSLSPVPTNDRFNLSVIIVSWNTRELLSDCLKSLVPECPERTEIFVVDNASADGTVQLLRAQFPAVRVLANASNVGFAAANNQALRQAQGEFVLLLNPDTLVKRGAIHALVQFMRAQPRAGAAAPRLLNSDGSLQISCEPAPTLFSEFWRLFHLDRFQRRASYAPARWQSEEPQQVEVARGACLIVRRALFEQLGWFDEQFYIYSEEVDLCQRLREAGYEIYWLRRAQVVHFGGSSTRQASDLMFLKLYQAKVQYFRKHFGAGGALAYQLILLAAALGRLVVAPFALFERAPQRLAHWHTAKQYGRLILDLPQM